VPYQVPLQDHETQTHVDINPVMMVVAALPACATIIQMELYDTYALVNSDGVTVLAGDA